MFESEIEIPPNAAIDSEHSLAELLRDLQDSNFVIRSQAAEALGKFKDNRAAYSLPNILTLILTESGEKAYRAIQANC